MVSAGLVKLKWPGFTPPRGLIFLRPTDPEDLGYYDRIAAAVANAPRVAIVGHGTGKASSMAALSERLREHHLETQGRVVATATIDVSASTDGQLLALGREMLTRNVR